MLWSTLKSCEVPSRPPSLALPVDVLKLTIGQTNFFSLKGHWDTIDERRRAMLNGRAELFRALRHKTVHALRVNKEAEV